MKNTPKDIAHKLPYEAPAVEVIELSESPSILAGSPPHSYRGSGGDDDEGWFDGN